MSKREYDYQRPALKQMQQLHRELGLSKVEVGRRMNADPSYVTRILSGERPITQGMAPMIAQAYGMDRTASILFHVRAGYMPEGIPVEEVEATLDQFQREYQQQRARLTNGNPTIEMIVSFLERADLSLQEEREFLDMICMAVTGGYIKMGKTMAALLP